MNKKIVLLVSIIIGSVILFGCSQDSFTSLKENSNMTKEYNDIIAIYNKLALSFTSLAKKVDKEIDKPNGFNNEFWKEYSSIKEKIDGHKNKIKKYEFQSEEIQGVTNDLYPFIDNLEKYIEVVNKFNTADIDRDDFIEIHRNTYESMLQQSSKIVKSFDTIYNEVLLNESN